MEVFIRWADVVVLIYSITDRASFNLVIQLLEQIGKLRPRRAELKERAASVAAAGALLGGAVDKSSSSPARPEVRLLPKSSPKVRSKLRFP